MGKYSLENYEMYQAFKFRPKSLKECVHNVGSGKYRLIEASWLQMEPERAAFDFTAVLCSLNSEETNVLVLDDAPPAWVKDHEAAALSALIRRMGAELDDHPSLFAVVVKTDKEKKVEREAVLRAYAAAFKKTHLLLPLTAGEDIAYFQKQSYPYGLMVDCDEDVLSICERFAALGVQDTWQHAPVLLRLSNLADSVRIRKEAMRWHALAANTDLGLGYQLALRRLTVPKKVSSNGAMPLRFWWVNTGSAPIYQSCRVRLRLEGNGQGVTLVTNEDPKLWITGDAVHNEILHLPKLPGGSYQLSVGIFTQHDQPINLAMDCLQMDGFYSIGTIEIDDQPRPELFTIWDHYYPDGYYPLEDPKQPG